MYHAVIRRKLKRVSAPRIVHKYRGNAQKSINAALQSVLLHDLVQGTSGFA